MIKLYTYNRNKDVLSHIYYKDMDELENRLKKISTAYYNVSDYYVRSMDFGQLKKDFIERYNPNYFTIDEENERIILNKLTIGDKRKLIFARREPTGAKIDKIEKSINRFIKTHGLVYDKDLGTLEFDVNDKTKVTINIDVDTLKVGDTTINECDIESLTLAAKKIKDVNKFFNRLRNRKEKEDL